MKKIILMFFLAVSIIGVSAGVIETKESLMKKILKILKILIFLTG